LTEQEINTEIIEVLESVGLVEAIDKMPSELSGGMRKRIASQNSDSTEIILYDELPLV
jgi:phospholipid/cholesterol/gamma-HCH transport system ATP-binding protein